jgi:type III pantothenate kinase
VLGVFDGVELIQHWRISTNDERTSDELALLVSELLRLRGIEFHPEKLGIAISSVVPRLTAALRQMTDEWFGVKAVVLEPGTKTGMPILYDNPKEVGADRIANAVGAFDLYGGPCICVDFGTATTFDAISGRGEYLGGAIIPGIEISLDALFGRAAALRRVELVEPRNVIGKNTVESMQSGAVYGFAAQVDGLCERIKRELGGATVVATGGLAGLITPLSAMIEHHEPWITLIGLRIIWERNQ